MLEAIEPAVFDALNQLVHDRINSDPLYEGNNQLDKISALYSIAISLRRIAENLEQSTIVSIKKQYP